MGMIELPGGTIEYDDTGGSGPVVLLLHGLLMDASLWARVVPELAGDHRCITPTLPLGAHRTPAAPDADLSLLGIARMVAELIEDLDLNDVTVVGNDTGGALAQILLTDDQCERVSSRISRLVLVSCEAFDNVPPGLTGRTIVLTGRLSPRLFGLFMQQMRMRAMRRLPIAFGWLTKRGDATTKGWMRALLDRSPSRAGIRRDAVKVLRALGSSGRAQLVEAGGRLGTVPQPALVVWARADRVMPLDHGQRLVSALPHARLVEIDDSYTLVPLDQPEQLAKELSSFIAE